MSDLFNLSGKTALVTGCTRGIGQAMTLALAKAGADIVLVQRSTKNTDTKQLVLGTGRKCEIVVAELSDSKQVENVVPTVVKELKLNIDILLNCAGIQRRHPAAEFPNDDWNEVLQVNLTTVFLLARDVGAHLLERKAKGKIINMASLLSFQGGLTVPAYAAAKGGVAQLTKALSNEWSSKGINVNAIAPGYIATDMNTALIADPVRSRQILERIPAARWGTPEDFAGPVVFLAAPASDYVDGEILTVDGGWMGR